jgi:hypothetical protein
VREPVESKGSSLKRASRRADSSRASKCGSRGSPEHARVASTAVAVKGLRFASMNALERGAPLTAILAAAVFEL